MRRINSRAREEGVASIRPAITIAFPAGQNAAWDVCLPGQW